METLELNNKYYIPSIEEFYSGFEHEYFNITKQDGSGEWVKSNEFSNNWYYEENPHYAVIKEIDKEHVRVKYLSKEDIESLGFEYLWTDESTTTTKKFIHFKRFNKEWEIRGFTKDSTHDMHFHELVWSPTDNGLSICIGPDSKKPAPFFIFFGFIKNLSELKVLLKQLGINE